MSGYVKTPTVFQLEATECGAACLSMIFLYFGKYMPLERLRIETGVSRDGCNAGNIVRCAKKYGLECKGYKKSVGALKNISLPCIIHWDNNHFVVFEGCKGKYAYINDPASGRRRLSDKELKEGFSGIVLTFEKTKSFVKEGRKNIIWDYFRKTTASQKSYFAVLFFIALLLCVPMLAVSLFVKELADGIFSASSEYSMPLCAVLLMLCFSVYAILLYCFDSVLSRLRKKTVLVSAKNLFHKLMRLPVGFFEQRYTGDIAGVGKSNGKVSDFITKQLFRGVFALVSFLACFVLMLILSPYLALVGLISFIAEIITARVSALRLRDASVRYRQDSGMLAGKLIAGISIADTLKAAGAESAYVKELLSQYEKTDAYARKMRKIKAVSTASGFFLRIAFAVIMLIAGCVLINSKALSIGELFCCFTLYMSLLAGARAVSDTARDISSVKAETGRIEDILNYPRDSKFEEASGKRDVSTKLQGRVELRNISFSYNPLSPEVVSEISFTAGCGSSIALVGASGSGKSTVSKIISGLYVPSSGELLFDDMPSEEIPEKVLNASISTVSQRITLFSGSVRDNLTMWNPHIPLADMISAAKDACIHEDIVSKPGGYDYILSEGGRNFSGGQRQRLEIARALATNPTVLIMDEATSALDSATEKKIMDNIKRRGITCIVSAHRLSAIRDCDTVIVMSKGKIAQYGTHATLRNEEGIYKELISL